MINLEASKATILTAKGEFLCRKFVENWKTEGSLLTIKGRKATITKISNPSTVDETFKVWIKFNNPRFN